MNIEILPVIGKEVWPLFAPHHYLTGSLNPKGPKCFLAVLPDGAPVAFTSSISFPHATIKGGRREHRTVVLPDFQGFGLGARLSDWLAEWHIRQGHRFYSRTTHPRLGAYREASPLWRATSGSRRPQHAQKLVARRSSGGVTARGEWKTDLNRLAFSHEYVGRSAE